MVVCLGAEGPRRPVNDQDRSRLEASPQTPDTLLTVARHLLTFGGWQERPAGIGRPVKARHVGQKGAFH